MASTPELRHGLRHSASPELSAVAIKALEVEFRWDWMANDIAASTLGVTLHRAPGDEASAYSLQGYRAEMQIADEDPSALRANSQNSNP
jgi:hypothetical protein